jgi:hypothetical protein
MALPLGALLGIGSKILDKVIPDPAARDAAKLKLLELEQAGEFKGEDLRYSAINTEAASSDKWTSRARPSFMYVMYVMILSSIPFGVFYAINPVAAMSTAEGLKAWLAAIPDALWAMFGAGYVGYSASRSYDKGMEMKHGKGQK